MIFSYHYIKSSSTSSNDHRLLSTILGIVIFIFNIK
jgi:hypothetical protein